MRRSKLTKTKAELRLEARKRAARAQCLADAAKKALPQPCKTKAMGKPARPLFAAKAPRKQAPKKHHTSYTLIALREICRLRRAWIS